MMASDSCTARDAHITLKERRPELLPLIKRGFPPTLSMMAPRCTLRECGTPRRFLRVPKHAFTTFGLVAGKVVQTPIPTRYRGNYEWFGSTRSGPTRVLLIRTIPVITGLMSLDPAGEDSVLLLLYWLLRRGQIVLRRIDGRNDLPKPTPQLKAA
jgi:hypothetical protein